MAGYSGTPLARKLGIKAGSRIHAVNTPGDYADLLAPLPDGVVFTRRLDSATDIVHLFCRTRNDLATGLAKAMGAMRPAATIWVSWPKKSSGVESEITEDTIREIALPMGLVDIKVCAVDQTWSGVKLVIRKALRT